MGFASAIAAATQLAWLLWAGIAYPYCVLFDAWGMLAVVVLAAGGGLAFFLLR